MATKKISELNVAGTIGGNEMVELVQSGLSVRSTVSNIIITASVVNGNTNNFFVKLNYKTPAFATNNSQSMVVNSNLLIYVNNTPHNFASGSSITMPATMLAGNDYGIYATIDNTLIATYTTPSSVTLGGYTAPAGYNATNSRLVGGFYFAHYDSSPLSILGRSRSSGNSSISMSNAVHGLVTGDYIDVILMTDLTYNIVNVQITVSGTTITFPNPGSNESYTADTAGKVYKINNRGIINQYSIWDLKFKPKCPDPRGMILVNDSFWVDIWLTGNNYLTSGTSRKGERIADGQGGVSYPLISTKMGGNGTSRYANCTWFTSNEVLAHWGKKLLSYADFCVAAFNGTTENGSYGTDNQYTCRPPGAMYTSKWGMEQSYGIMWIWGADLNFYSGTINYDWQNTTEGRGYMYTTSTGTIAGIYGGSWNDGVAGSRSSYWHDYVWDSNYSIGLRGRCDHLVVP